MSVSQWLAARSVRGVVALSDRQAEEPTVYTWADNLREGLGALDGGRGGRQISYKGIGQKLNVSKKLQNIKKI